MLILPPQPPTLQSKAKPTWVPYTQAEGEFLESLDEGQTPSAHYTLRPQDRAAFAWLRASARFDARKTAPENPFPQGSEAHLEAERLRHFVLNTAPLPKREELSLKLGGTRLALWRWMKARSRQSLSAPQRMAMENRLMEKGGPGLIRTNAARHALCFALAERDEARLADVKGRLGNEGEYAQELVKSFQTLFALLDGPSPVFRLWRLPELRYEDRSLGALGTKRIWMRPADANALPELPRGTTWIAPSTVGDSAPGDSTLSGGMELEAKELASRLLAAKTSAFFAPSRQDFERHGFLFFPMLMELDDKGSMKSIRMGDAAPSKP
jgi:hypothetical protein